MIGEIERIQSSLRSGLIVKARLAQEAGIHVNSLSKVADPEWSPNLATVRKIIAALDRIGA